MPKPYVVCVSCAMLISLSTCCIADCGLTFTFSEYDPNETYPKRPPPEKVDWAGNMRVSIKPEEPGYPLQPVVRLNFTLETLGNKKAVFFFSAIGAQAGAGLVVEHIAQDGTIEKQMLPYKARWHWGGRFLELQSKSLTQMLQRPFPPRMTGAVGLTFDITVRMYDHFKFQEEGIYRISYEHPWHDMERTNVHCLSQPVYVANVNEQSVRRVRQMFDDDPHLELASHMIQHVLESGLPPWRRAKDIGIVDKAIAIDMDWQDAFQLIGSPDYIALPSHSQPLSWCYATSPVADYYIAFRNGKVIDKGRNVQWYDP